MFLMIATILIGGGILGLVFYVWNYTQRPASLPPGPTCLPWVGYSTLTTETSSSAQLEAWRKLYGPVFTVCFNGKYGMVVNDYAGAEEILAREDVRPALPHEINATGGKKGISVEAWSRVCSLCKDYLAGHWEARRTSKIQDEAAYISDFLHGMEQAPTDIKQLFSPCVANVLCAFLYGQCYDQDDKELLHLLYTTEVISSYTLEGVFSKILGFTSPSDSSVSAAVADMSSLHRKMIDKRRARLEEDGYDDPRDFIEFCLCQHEESDSEEDVDTFDNSLVLALNYFVYNTTPIVSQMLMSQAKFLATHPDVQRKIQVELERVMGLMPAQFDVSDRQESPYTRAVFTEALRLSPATVVLHPRILSQDVEHRGFTLPKDTTVYLNLYSSHRDGDIWKDASTFNPGRFLTEDGDYIESVEQYRPFTQTVYPVDELAEDIVFVLMASLLQCFRVSLPQETNGVTPAQTESKQPEQTAPTDSSTNQLVFTSRF